MNVIKMILKVIAAIFTFLFVVALIAAIKPSSAQSTDNVQPKPTAEYTAQREAINAADAKAKHDAYARAEVLAEITVCVEGTDALFAEIDRVTVERERNSGDVYEAYGARIQRDTETANAIRLACYDTL